jgi:hypothetical protein
MRGFGLPADPDRRERHPRVAARQRRARHGALLVAGLALLLALAVQVPNLPREQPGNVATVIAEVPPPIPAEPVVAQADPLQLATPPVDFALPMEPMPPLAAELMAPAVAELAALPPVIVLPDLRDREMGVETLDLVDGFVAIEPAERGGLNVASDVGLAREMVEARAAEGEATRGPPLAAPRQERDAAVFPPPGAFPARPGTASVAIIIDDLGPAQSWTARAIALPGPLTMSFLPYAESLPERTREALRHSHEVFLHMPMQPLGNENPGKNALHVGMSAADIRERLGWAIGRVDQAIGMNNHMGSRMTEDASAMRVVMEVMRERGLMFVDSRTSPRSAAAGAAAEAGLPHTSRDVFLDHFPGPAFVRRQLVELENRARRTGTAVAIAHPMPTTMDVLEEWIPAAKKRGLRFIKASEVIAARGCDGKSAAGKCGLLHAAGQRQPADDGG